ncbi:MAG: ABC transporter C-terminal domain-containing protein, partial [Polyangiaceae bacterium]
ASKPAGSGSKKKLTYGERIELDGILDVIAKAEARVVATEKALSDPGVYAKPEDAKKLQGELSFAQADVARLVARWEDLESRKG